MNKTEKLKQEIKDLKFWNKENEKVLQATRKSFKDFVYSNKFSKQEAIKEELYFLLWLDKYIDEEIGNGDFCYPIPLKERIEELKSKLGEEK